MIMKTVNTPISLRRIIDDRMFDSPSLNMPRPSETINNNWWIFDVEEFDKRCLACENIDNEHFNNSFVLVRV